MPIPPFNGSGLLPPFLLDPTYRAGGSPYSATIVELVGRFSTSPERLAILDGLIRFRADLHVFGITQGFQWIDGSFVENIDATRAPKDVDVVTFFQRPLPLRLTSDLSVALAKNADLFYSPRTKLKYMTDAYFVDLDVDGTSIVSQTRYWFDLFSHRRGDQHRKGMLEIPLGTLADDSEAAKMLKMGGDP